MRRCEPGMASLSLGDMSTSRLPSAMLDFFICHASEDKADVARPLAEQLRAAGLSVWYDEFSLKLGDSLRESIDRGLGSSRFGIVILSPSFFAKRWPSTELNGLFAKEMAGGKCILPIWHKITHAELLNHSPILADRVAACTVHGLDIVLQRILDAIDPNKVHTAVKGRVIAISPSVVRLHCGEWEVQTRVAVTNLGATPAYAVMLRLLIDGANVPSGSLRFDADQLNPPVEMSIGNVIVSADGIRLNATRKDGRQVIFFTFHTVPAKGTRFLSVKGSVPVKSSAEISIVGFQENPQELIRKEGAKLAVKFQAPEDVVVNGAVWTMRRRE